MKMSFSSTAVFGLKSEISVLSRRKFFVRRKKKNISTDYICRIYIGTHAGIQSQHLC